MISVKKTKAILPWWQLGLMVAGCVIGVWWLFPNNAELIDDLIRDGSYPEARQRLNEISSAERTRKAARYGYLDVKLGRLELPSNPTAGQLDQLWILSVQAWRQADFSREILLEMSKQIPALPDPTQAWSVVQSTEAQAPPAQLQGLAAVFSRAALAANQPEAAAGLYATAHPANGRSEAEVLELARLWQLAGDLENALEVLGVNPAPNITIRRIALLRQLNRNREAFNLMLSLSDTQPPEKFTTEQAERFKQVALAAGLAVDAVPFYERYAATRPTDISVQRELRDLMVSAGQTSAALGVAQSIVLLEGHQADDLRALAHLNEYTGQPSAAFDAWMSLATSNDQEAINRLFALNPGLYRDRDLARVLEKIIPPESDSPYMLEAARLEKNLGRYDEAKSYYERYLVTKPHDTHAIREVAQLYQELFEFADAEKWYQRLADIHPADIESRLAIANTLILQNRPEEAFLVYDELLQQSTDKKVIEPFIRIAQSLGRPGDLVRGLRRQIDQSENSTARDYLRLAYNYARAGQTTNQQAALVEGLEIFPQDGDMRLELARGFALRKDYRSAQAVLARHPRLHADLPAAALYLDLMRLNNDTKTERAFLTNPWAGELADDESILERVALAREALREPAVAENIWRHLLTLRPGDFNRVAHLARVVLIQGRPAEANQLLAPFLINPTEEALRLAAEISAVAGDHRAAEKYQLAFLDLSQAPKAADWGALGDIRLSRGDREGAKRAYATGLSILLASLTSANESSLTDAQLLSRAITLPIDDRRYLVYLHARINDAKLATALAEQILDQNPSDRQTLLVLASLKLERRDGQAVLRLARTFLHYYPDDHQGLFFLGTGHYLAKEYTSANAVLRALKTSQFASRKYPYETDLASSALQAGDWYRAMLSYQELLRNHELGDELRAEVRQVLDGIYREHGPQVEGTADHTRLKRAEVWRYQLLHAAHLSDRHWLEVAYDRDAIAIDAAPGIQSVQRDRSEINATLTRTHSRRTKIDLWLGVYGDGILAGARWHYLFARDRGLSIDYSLNDRATDSLALEAIDGREDRGRLTLNWLIEADLNLVAQIHTRSVHVANEKVGSGEGITVNLDQTLWRQGPRINLGYRGSVANFTPQFTQSLSAAPIADPAGGRPARDAIFANLVSRRLNRHGTGLTVTDNLADAWVYRFALGMDYDFELSSFGWSSNLALSFFPRKSIEISAESGYASSATDSNAGSAAVQTKFFFRFHY